MHSRLAAVAFLLLIAGSAAAKRPAKPTRSPRGGLAAQERFEGQIRPLYRSTSHVAFRRMSGRPNPAAGRTGAEFRGEYAASGIAIYEAAPETRHSLATDMIARGFVEIPCYVTADGRWVVPTDLVVIQFRPDAADAEIRRFLAGENAALITARRNHDRQFIVRVPDPAQALALADSWHDSKLVLWAQASCVRQAVPRFTPNDPMYPLQWHLQNTGQGGGLYNHDVSADRAWDITRGDSNVVIAVLDDGFVFAHPDLAANTFTNTADPVNSVDDDFNGYTDDYHGWDFTDSDNDPAPGTNDGHGVAVAGLAVAVVNNSVGVAGLANRCRLLPLRVYSTSLDNDIDWAAAVEYAAGFSNVAVISISYLIDPTPLNMGAMRYALVRGRGGKGCVISVALGNDGVRRRYVEDLAAAPEALGVGGNSNYDKKPWFADYGPALNVVAGAGGGNRALVTTDRLGAAGYEPGNYSTNSAEGTSFSCPQAAALAALLASARPDWTGLEIRRQIELTCDKIDPGVAAYNVRGWSELYGFGRINAWAALATPATPWDPYEPDNSSATANAIVDGELQYRSLATGADTDWARITITNPADIRLTVLGTTNAALALYSAAAALLATNDPDAYPYAVVTANGLAATTYYARVSSPSGATVPFYGLHFGILNEADGYEMDDARTNAKPISPQEMQYHTLYPTGDADWVTFTLDRAAGVQIWTMGEINGDTALFLRDSGGGLISSDTDTNYYYSFLSNSLAPGTYYIEVQSWTNTVPLASYQLQLEVYGPDSFETNNAATQAVAIASGQPRLCTIYPNGDEDWFTFTLSNRANVLVLTDTINPLWLGDTILTLLNSNVVGIATNDDGNDLDDYGYGYSAIYTKQPHRRHVLHPGDRLWSGPGLLPFARRVRCRNGDHQHRARHQRRARGVAG
ncbi:MAG: hypothetical protein BWK77_05155 [Verrucomicrobia bacterium A1]|nr:MAG: hypothetical protein BWK77_05155 [Verrucomicrobia bacterium A1]